MALIMKFLIPLLLLLAQDGPAPLMQQDWDRAFKTGHNAMVSLKVVYPDGTPMHKGTIWCEGNWYILGAGTYESHGPYQEAPRFTTDSTGTQVMRSNEGVKDMTCHAEKDGMTGTVVFDLAAGSRRIVEIVIK